MMPRRYRRNRSPAGTVICTIALAVFAVEGRAAVRQLPGVYVPDATITVTIVVEAPDGAVVVAIEDAPPVGWMVDNISDGGALDTLSEKVKWGPFFAPSIPDAVTYEATPPSGAFGALCFSGTVSVDGLDAPIAGQSCLYTSVPAVDTWGLVLTALLTLVCGTVVLRRASDHFRKAPGIGRTALRPEGP